MSLLQLITPITISINIAFDCKQKLVVISWIMLINPLKNVRIK